MKVKHNKTIINNLYMHCGIAYTIAFLGLVWILGSLIESKRIISPCPENGCHIKVVYAQDIEMNTPKGIIERSKHPKQIAHIWNKETTKGTNKNPNALHNICKSQGKSNEFGYGGMALKICFESFEESVRVVDEWLTKRDNEALCYYNLGIRKDGCEYVK